MLSNEIDPLNRNQCFETFRNSFGLKPKLLSRTSREKPDGSPCVLKDTNLSHGVPPPDRRGPVLERPHGLLARQQVVGPVRRPLQVGSVARWQNLIPGTRDQILQRSIAEQ